MPKTLVDYNAQDKSLQNLLLAEQGKKWGNAIVEKVIDRAVYDIDPSDIAVSAGLPLETVHYILGLPATQEKIARRKLTGPMERARLVLKQSVGMAVMRLREIMMTAEDEDVSRKACVDICRLYFGAKGAKDMDLKEIDPDKLDGKEILEQLRRITAESEAPDGHREVA